MDFFRAREKHLSYLRYKKSFTHNTALIAGENNEVIGVFEYEIKNIEEAEIINFDMFDIYEEPTVLKGFINEINYWNPHLKRIIYNEEQNLIEPRILINLGFQKNSIWTLNIPNYLEVFKVDIKDITPEQLTVDSVKFDRVNSWIEKPEDIIICCVKIGNKIVSIDGHSRLVAAYNKGFRYVYAYLEPDSSSIEFFKTCMKWCEDAGVFTIEDLSKRVVTPEEHEKIWVSKCQTYLKQQEAKTI